MSMKELRYLIVDDHFLLRTMVTNTLSGAGATKIDWANDGPSALEKMNSALMKSEPYDIVFLDWSMPEISGYDVLVNLRHDQRHANTTIIMLTSEMEGDSIAKALAAGADDYITKPYMSETVLSKVLEIAAKRETKI